MKRIGIEGIRKELGEGGRLGQGTMGDVDATTNGEMEETESAISWGGRRSTGSGVSHPRLRGSFGFGGTSEHGYDEGAISGRILLNSAVQVLIVLRLSIFPTLL